MTGWGRQVFAPLGEFVGLTPMIDQCRVHAGFHEGRGVHRADEVFWKADGAGFPVENRSRPLTVEGELTGTVVTFIDITERKPAG